MSKSTLGGECFKQGILTPRSSLFKMGAGKWCGNQRQPLWYSPPIHTFTTHSYIHHSFTHSQLIHTFTTYSPLMHHSFTHSPHIHRVPIELYVYSFFSWGTRRVWRAGTYFWRAGTYLKEYSLKKKARIQIITGSKFNKCSKLAHYLRPFL